MNLSMAVDLEKYEITQITVDELLKKRLQDLGLIVGCSIKVLSNHKGAVILIVRGARVVLGKPITEGIQVVPVTCKGCIHQEDPDEAINCHRMHEPGSQRIHQGSGEKHHGQ